jgi:hypothetical protein
VLGANRGRGQALAYLLKQHGLQAECAESFHDLIQMAADGPCQLVLLDAEVGEHGHTDGVKRLRGHFGDDGPVLMGVAFSDRGQQALRRAGEFDWVLDFGFQRADLRKSWNTFPLETRASAPRRKRRTPLQPCYPLLCALPPLASMRCSLSGPLPIDRRMPPSLLFETTFPNCTLPFLPVPVEVGDDRGAGRHVWR